MALRRRHASAAPADAAPLLGQIAVKLSGKSIKVSNLSPRRKTKTSKRKPRPQDDAITEYVARGRAMVAGTLETRGATVGDLVGAWVHAHELVHKVPPAELHAEWSSIYAATRNVLTVHFQSEPADLLLFILWAAREQSKRVGDKAGRLSWRFVFSASRVSDYRVFTAVGA